MAEALCWLKALSRPIDVLYATQSPLQHQHRGSHNTTEHGVDDVTGVLFFNTNRTALRLIT